MSINYEVIFEPFTERHFIRTFAKKYKGAWKFTLDALLQEFRFFDELFLKNTAETIVDSAEVKICKTEFKISGTQESRHGSGNRCIIAKHKNTNKIYILLVYHKNDLGGGNETANWKRVIKENYLDYSNIL